MAKRRVQKSEVDQSESDVFSKYWLFIEKFRGNSLISKGDARAYVSALTDIISVEAGIKDVEGIKWALGEALKILVERRLEKSECEKILQRWRLLDRRLLQDLIRKGSSKMEIPTREKDIGLRVISLFTGSYGLDLGFEYAGFRVSVALDIDPASEQIVKANRPEVPFILKDIAEISTIDLLKEEGLGKGEVDVLTGGPPCQPFSTAGRRQGLNDPRSSPLREFIRVINEARPKAFVMEEVTGILNARLRHIPIKNRDRPLVPEELPGSVWRIVLEELHKTSYRIAWKVLNAADFGTPQIRNRVIVIGFRKDIRSIPCMPSPTHVRPGVRTLLGAKPWLCLLDAIVGREPGEFLEMPPKYMRYMKYVPPGGNWRQIPADFLPDAMNGAFVAGGGRMGFYRRLSWFEPSPTLVTTPVMKGSMLIHPVEDRPLSVNEYKILQGFPQDWQVPGSLSTKYRKIGEAVPPLLSYAVASLLKKELLGIRRTGS
ncbi:MAG: DNA cytosine methyltransferase [Candidatus Jordarchaeaceae archaeon]